MAILCKICKLLAILTISRQGNYLLPKHAWHHNKAAQTQQHHGVNQVNKKIKSTACSKENTSTGNNKMEKRTKKSSPWQRHRKKSNRAAGGETERGHEGYRIPSPKSEPIRSIKRDGHLSSTKTNRKDKARHSHSIDTRQGEKWIPRDGMCVTLKPL